MSRIPPRQARRAGIVATATAAVAAVLFASGAVALAGTLGPIDHPATDIGVRGTHTVTLLTGDVVTVHDLGTGRQTVQIDRPRGARGGVRAETIGKDLYVLPDEVLPYLAAKLIDRRLFDVTLLIEQGYDDARSDGIPLILSYADKVTARAAVPATPATPNGSTKVRRLPSINGEAVKATKKRARDVWADITPPQPPSAAKDSLLDNGIAKIWLDGKVKPALAESTAQVGAPSAWAAGLDGRGVKVAVLDSGYDANHPDLAGRVSQAVSFVPGETVHDVHGHGTHTASTVGGSGAASDGNEKGVAPGAELLIGKVLGDDGYGEDSWVIAGMEWAAAQGADVISMSLGGAPSDGTDPVSMAVNELTESSGALFVIAAGNAGAEASVSAPGAADAALTIGAVDNADALAWFSSVGPRYGDYGLKPDLAAPGVDILAAKSGGNDADGYYQPMSGTSMATPHVAGAAAILAQQHPDWSAGRLKDALMSTSKQVEYTAYQVGAGRLDVAASTTAALTATGSTYFGFLGWPQENLAPIERTITFSNSGDTDLHVGLSQSASITGGPYDVDPSADAGTPAPEGLFTLSASSVTVPAHGAATVTLTAHPGLGVTARRYLGQVVATDAAGTVRTRTQFGLYLEDERHDLRLELRDRAGSPTAGWLELQRFGTWGDPYFVQIDASGVANLRMRAGTYSAVAVVDVTGSHGADSAGVALLGDPEIRLDRAREVVLDASKSREVSAVVPKRTEDFFRSMNWYRSDGGVSSVDMQYLMPATVDSMFVLPTKEVTMGSFEYFTRWRKAHPLLTLTHQGAQIAVMVQAGSSLYDGKASLDVVFAGDGAPEAYAGMQSTGRAVLVTRSDSITASQQAQAAAAAGAALLLIVNDRPGKYLDWVGSDLGEESAVPVASLTQAVGAQLVAQAQASGLSVKVEGVANSPYVYDLVDPHQGWVPTNLTYRPKERDLASVDMKFYGDQRYASGEFRWDFRPHRRFSLGFPLKVDMPGSRVDYVSTRQGTTWAESAATGPGMALVSSGDQVAYVAGTRTVREWFGPVTRPRNGGGFWSSTRFPGAAQFNVQPWADGDGTHAGYLAEGDSLRLTVSEAGSVLAETVGWASANLWDITDGPHTYEIELEASRDPAVWRLSPATRTRWTVVSKPVVDPDYGDLMPLLQLDYDVATDAAGRVKAGKQALGLRASHLPGAVGAGRITGLRLWISYDDGAHWQSTPVASSGSGYTAEFSRTAGAYVSFKVEAWDDAGNKITQEVTRAYQVVAKPHP